MSSTSSHSSPGLGIGIACLVAYWPRIRRKWWSTPKILSLIFKKARTLISLLMNTKIHKMKNLYPSKLEAISKSLKKPSAILSSDSLLWTQMRKRLWSQTIWKSLPKTKMTSCREQLACSSRKVLSKMTWISRCNLTIQRCLKSTMAAEAPEIPEPLTLMLVLQWASFGYWTPRIEILISRQSTLMHTTSPNHLLHSMCFRCNRMSQTIRKVYSRIWILVRKIRMSATEINRNK